MKLIRTIPQIVVNFNDNPYLLKDYTRFDYYSIMLPVHIYIRNERKINVYSITRNFYEYKMNQDLLIDPVLRYFSKMKLVLEKHTVNNQNINFNNMNLIVYHKKFHVYNKNHFPLTLYPDQSKVNQWNNEFAINKSPYTISTVLTFNRDCNKISDIYNYMGTIDPVIEKNL